MPRLFPRLPAGKDTITERHLQQKSACFGLFVPGVPDRDCLVVGGKIDIEAVKLLEERGDFCYDRFET